MTEPEEVTVLVPEEVFDYAKDKGMAEGEYDELRETYRQLTKDLHPDLNDTEGCKEEFDTLTDVWNEIRQEAGDGDRVVLINEGEAVINDNGGTATPEDYDQTPGDDFEEQQEDEYGEEQEERDYTEDIPYEDIPEGIGEWYGHLLMAEQIWSDKIDELNQEPDFQGDWWMKEYEWVPPEDARVLSDYEGHLGAFMANFEDFNPQNPLELNVKIMTYELGGEIKIKKDINYIYPGQGDREDQNVGGTDEDDESNHFDIRELWVKHDSGSGMEPIVDFLDATLESGIRGIEREIYGEE